MPFSFDPVYLLLLVPALLTWWAQAKVREIYRKYEAIPNQRGMNGTQVAQSLFMALNLNHVTLGRIPGTLTDHYDPQTRTLRLSDGTVSASSVTALGIVAHEVGHAVQDVEGYRFMRLRETLARPLSLLSSLSPLVFIGGMMYGNSLYMSLGGLMLASQAIFALVTLPVERNASSRAVQMLDQTGLAATGESKGVREVLNAAAFTYVTNLGRRVAIFLFFIAVIGSTRGVAPL